MTQYSLHKRKLSGFSIVELLIGTVLGLTLTAGMISMFVTNKQLIKTTRNLNILQENIRFTESVLNRGVLLSAYRSPPAAGSTVQFTRIADIYTGALPYIAATSNDGTNNSDTLTIRYQGSGDGAGAADNSIRDCARVGVDTDAMATNIYSINGNNQLQCVATNTTTTPSTTTTITLVENVETMHVLLGEDTDADGYANRYLAPDDGNLTVGNIVSIRIAFVFTSDDSVTSELDTRTYTVLDASWNPTDDRRLRSVVSKTFQLRNRVGAS